MAKVLFAGGRADSVTPVVGGVGESTTAGAFDPTYCDASLSITNQNYCQLTFLDLAGAPVDVVTGETVYLHFEWYPGASSYSVNFNLATLVNAAGQPWLALRFNSTTTLGLYYNSGTGASPVWTQIGTTFSAPTTVRQEFDLKLTLGSPHTAEWSINRTLYAGGTFTQAGLTALRGAYLHAAYGNATAMHFSQVMATEGISTINGKVKYSRATGAGANSGWTGTAADVNEAINSDATVNAAASAGLRQTYAMGDVTVPLGLTIKSVFHWMRGKNDGISPLNIKSVARSAGTDYPATNNVTGIGTSFGALNTRWDNDPATALPWTQAGWNAVEMGYDSVA
jgi:hypothetical protein